MAKQPNHYALVVGIDDYPNFRSLKGAKRDAKDFAEWLVDDVTGGGIPSANLQLVLSKKNPLRPIHEDIDDALDVILDGVDQAPGERLYLYFSGHGLARSNTGTDLCLAKWSTRRKGLALDSEDYLSMLMESGRFREVIMLLDCCRIRKIRKRALPPTNDPAKPDDLAAKSRSFVGHATEFLNAAHEAATANDVVDNANDPIVRGHFTRALIKALKGEAAEVGGGVRASRLKEYLEINTPEIAKLAKHSQMPEVQNGLPANPDPIFGSATPPAHPNTVSVKVSFANPQLGQIILEDGNLTAIKQGVSSSGPWSLKLKRGNYVLRDQNGAAERSIRITGHESGVVNVQF